MELHNSARGRLSLPLLAIVFALAAAGCSDSGAKLHPVSGKVLFKDAPAEGAQIVFQPTGEENSQYRGPRPAATVGPDGSFVLQTDPHGKGAPAGDYMVLVTWYPPDARDQANPKNKLPIKYADPASPKLKATVKEGNNELEPFRLIP